MSGQNNKEMELLYRIDERVKGMDKKIDTVVAHNEKQNGWIQKHSDRLTAIESKTSGKKEVVLFILWFSIIVANVVAWVK